ncbi:MAG: amino acid permease [Chitinophagaceae bacterium]|nr:amino acid permease [Chitinophagaceae bacterium]
MLNRSISRWEMVLLFINGVIGAGIFGLPSKIFKEIGVSSIAALVICACAVFVIVMCFAEVSSRFVKTGGPYVYALAAFGKLPAFLAGWLLLLTRFITYAALVNLLVTYLSVFSDWFTLPSSRIISILCISSFLAWINHIGVKNSTRVSNFFTIAKVLTLLLFIMVGIFYIEPANFEIKQTPGFASFSSTVLLLIFAFGGFESVLVNTGEVKNPAKSLPFALLLATLFIALIYILILVVSIGTLPSLASSDKPLAEAAGLFMGKTGAMIIATGALLSVTGTLNSIMMVGSRLPFAFSEEKQFPQVFSYIHPGYKTPTWSLVLFAAVTILISVSNTFIYAATISAITRVMTYGIVCISLVILRKKNAGQTGFFKIPFGNYFAIAGVLIAVWLLTASKLRELRDIAIALGVGLVIYALVELHKKYKISRSRINRL